MFGWLIQTLYLCDRYVGLNFFFNGNIRNQTKAHDCQRTALLWVENRQAEPNKLSFPRGQTPKYAGVLQNADGILYRPKKSLQFFS